MGFATPPRMYNGNIKRLRRGYKPRLARPLRFPKLLKHSNISVGVINPDQHRRTGVGLYFIVLRP